MEVVEHGIVANGLSVWRLIATSAGCILLAIAALVASFRLVRSQNIVSSGRSPLQIGPDSDSGPVALEADDDGLARTSGIVMVLRAYFDTLSDIPIT